MSSVSVSSVSVSSVSVSSVSVSSVSVSSVSVSSVSVFLMLYSVYMFYDYIIYFIAYHRSHRTHFSPSNAYRISFHFQITHAAPHFVSAPNLTRSSFPALPGWACAFELNKHSYGSRLCLFLYLHSSVVVHLPGNVIFFIAHSLFNCHSSLCCHCIHCFVIYRFHAHFSSINIYTVH